MILMPAPQTFGHSVNTGLHGDASTEARIGSPSDLPFRNSPEMSHMEPASIDYTQTAVYTHGRQGLRYDATPSEFSPWSMPSLTPDTCVTAPFTPALAQGWLSPGQCSTMPTTPADRPFSLQASSPRVMSPTRIFPMVPPIQTGVRPDSGIGILSPIDSSIARSPSEGYPFNPFSYVNPMDNAISAPVINPHDSLPGTPVDCRSPVGGKPKAKASKGSASTTRRPSQRLPKDQSKQTDEWLHNHVMQSKERDWAYICASIKHELPFTNKMTTASLQMRVHRALDKQVKWTEQQRPFDEIEQTAFVESFAALLKKLPQMLADDMQNHGSAHKWSASFIKMKLCDLYDSDLPEAPISKRAKSSSWPRVKADAATRTPLFVPEYTVHAVDGPVDRLSYQSPTSSMPSDMAFSAPMPHLDTTIWAPHPTAYNYTSSETVAPMLIPMACPAPHTIDSNQPHDLYHQSSYCMAPPQQCA